VNSAASNAAIAAGLLVFAAWAIRRSIRALRGADRIVADAILRTDPPAIDTQPGSDSDLLLDAVLAYYGPAGLQRLHNAINQHRKETP
jgi:hypothetical protein